MKQPLSWRVKGVLLLLICSVLPVSFSTAAARKPEPGQKIEPAVIPEALEELAIDDGSFEDSIGRADGSGTFIAVNRLTPTHYPATLSQVAIYFRNDAAAPAIGTPITVLVARNPSGSASFLNLDFQSTSAMVKSQGEFNIYDVPALTLTAGDFVVGFQINQQQNVSPVALDLTSSQGRSYYSTLDTSVFVPHDLAVPNFPGNYGIRARLTATPAYDAQFVSGFLPTMVNAGQTFSSTFAFMNIGTQPWVSGTGTSFSLVSQNPAFNQTWSISSVLLATFQIASGQQLTLNFTATAPSTPGTYTFQWQLYQNGGAGFFGQPSGSASLEVVAVTNQPVIGTAARQGKNLLVMGMNFAAGAKILLNGEQQKTIFDSTASLMGKKLGKKIASGDHLKVRNPDGAESNEFIYP